MNWKSRRYCICVKISLFSRENGTGCVCFKDCQYNGELKEIKKTNKDVHLYSHKSALKVLRAQL